MFVWTTIHKNMSSMDSLHPLPLFWYVICREENHSPKMGRQENHAEHKPLMCISNNHSTKKPVTTMLIYPWKCTVLHCKHLGNTWKPLVLMTRHFDYCLSTSEGDNQSVRSSVLGHQWFPGVSQVVTMYNCTFPGVG